MKLPSLPISVVKSGVAKRLEDVERRIIRAAESVGRKGSSVRLVGAVRGIMVDPVIESVRAGIKDFSEEYVPEGATKRRPVENAVGACVWHYVGSANHKNIALILETFDWFHSFDQLTLVRALVDALNTSEKKLDLLVEVNPLKERKRRGASKDAAYEIIETLRKVSKINIQGLSFHGEHFFTSEDFRRGFSETSSWYQEWKESGVLPKDANTLAMGHSNSIEQAIEMGSTMVRVGSALYASSALR